MDGMLILFFPLFLPAPILIFTANNKKSALISLSVIVVICVLILLHVGGMDLINALEHKEKVRLINGLPIPLWQSILNQLERLAFSLFAVVGVAAFFKYLAITSEMEDAKYLSVFGLSGPVLMYAIPSGFAWLVFTLLFLLLVLFRARRENSAAKIKK